MSDMWLSEKKKNAASDAWKAEHTTWVSIRIQNSSGIPDALTNALQGAGKSRNAYIIDAIREKLIRDGYMPESPESPKSK